ncbi:MAG: CDC48 family AAA ATPase [Planctomycetota bacterium]|nr:CDC48 family AAA ATPase [Planctomycetota bacterium]
MASHLPNGTPAAPQGRSDSPADGGPVARLRVAEALSKDVGRGLARMDPEDLRALGLSVGDVVMLQGKRATPCRAMPAHKEHRGNGVIQVDGLSRQNAGVGLDERVEIRPVACKPAASMTLRPTTIVPTARDLEYIGSLLDGLPTVEGDIVRASMFGSRSAEFTVVRTHPAGPVLITPATRLTVETGKTGATRARTEESARRVSYEDIGGLKNQLHRIREMIELPLRFPEVFERLGIDPPKGVLLHGPPGCGKTLIARTIAHETEAAFFSVSGPEIIHKFYGESEAHLRKIFDEAARSAPSIIFLDEIDSIAPKRENTQGEVEKRVVAQLLALMDGLNKRPNVVVIAATNIPNNIDPALRRPGRFDREIAISVPDRHGRRQILEIHSRGMPLAPDVSFDHLADITHGCVGADLEALCREAAMACLRTILHDIDFSARSLPYETLSRLEVTMDHFLAAFAEIEPSAVREVFVEVPRVSWDDIGGHLDAKSALVEALEWPLRHHALFADAGVRPTKGILLVGPPGTGKTLLARAAASQGHANFISVKGPELLSKFVGESERGLREVFRKARQAAPCVIFFDEIDALLPARSARDNTVGERVMSQFLTELDGVEELRGVLVLAATNRLDMLDPAVVRPGRFDRIIRLDEPDRAARLEIFRVHLRGKPVAQGVDLDRLTDLSQGMTGAQIAGVCHDAALRGLRRVIVALDAGRDAPPVCVQSEDLVAAIEDARTRGS